VEAGTLRAYADLGDALAAGQPALAVVEPAPLEQDD